ncbi:MAG: hypothetical protein HY646_03240 [Acidobacteria bacterium]|nr:hypothetical protein [Acidobacteriota bacterium]
MMRSTGSRGGAPGRKDDAISARKVQGLGQPDHELAAFLGGRAIRNAESLHQSRQQAIDFAVFGLF